MAGYRIDRINKEFLRLISESLTSSVKDDDAASAILLRVDTSRDLSHAKVFYSLLDERRRGTVAAALESVRGKVRGEIGRKMRIRQAPELHFIYDDTERRAREMEALIDSVMEKELSNNDEI